MGEQKLYDCICLHCGGAFTSKHKKAKYCSPSCGTSHRYRMERIDGVECSCAWCGKKFMAPRKRKYCGKEHRDTAIKAARVKNFKNKLTKQPELSLARVNMLAREEGLSYGRYVGKYGLK